MTRSSGNSGNEKCKEKKSRPSLDFHEFYRVQVVFTIEKESLCLVSVCRCDRFCNREVKVGVPVSGASVWAAVVIASRPFG